MHVTEKKYIKLIREKIIIFDGLHNLITKNEEEVEMEEVS